MTIKKERRLFYTFSEACEVLEISQSTLQSLVDNGEVEATIMQGHEYVVDNQNLSSVFNEIENLLVPTKKEGDK